MGQPGSLFCLAWLIRLVDLFLESSLNISHCHLFIANISHRHTNTAQIVKINPNSTSASVLSGAAINRWAWLFWFLKHLLKYHLITLSLKISHIVSTDTLLVKINSLQLFCLGAAINQWASTRQDGETSFISPVRCAHVLLPLWG